MSIFKRKPGGSILGNLVREIISAFVPLGLGKPLVEWLDPVPGLESNVRTAPPKGGQLYAAGDGMAVDQ